MNVSAPTSAPCSSTASTTTAPIQTPQSQPSIFSAETAGSIASTGSHCWLA